ncbi:MAG: formylmethanofuran dehydrogenase [Candidatus Atribacteria bacterium]|nr:formylmethanofuran dehydrogenase [Candidatus Atribacteria bacterium]
MIKLTIDRHNIDRMVNYGILLHGHAGPYLNLGIKMGLMALEILDAKGYFDLVTKVELKYHTPFSCLIDGLQISTGCTLGKGNIQVKDNPDIMRASFRSGNRNLLITLKPEIIKLLDFQKTSCEELGEQIMSMKNETLFDYEEINGAI